jgi:hypothetical protein
MAKKKAPKKMSEAEFKANNIKPEIPLDVQQSILGEKPSKPDKKE